MEVFWLLFSKKNEALLFEKRSKNFSSDISAADGCRRHRLDEGSQVAFGEGVMADRRSIDVLKELGSGKPASAGVVMLYRRAFAEFGARSLWNRKPSVAPTIA
jgi:hypothetical protein